MAEMVLLRLSRMIIIRTLVDCRYKVSEIDAVVGYQVLSVPLSDLFSQSTTSIQLILQTVYTCPDVHLSSLLHLIDMW